VLLSVEHAGNATQGSRTGRKDVVEQPAQLEDWIHIMTGFVYEQRNMLSCQGKEKAAL